MVVGVVERRRGVQVEVRQTAHALQRATSLSCSPMQRRYSSSSRANRMAMACRSSPAKPADPVLRGVGPGVAEDLRARRHALPELVGKGGQRVLRHAERAQAIPGERQRDPTLGVVHRVARVGGRLHRVQHFGEPRPPAGRVVEGQELVAPGHRRRAGQQDVLDVVEFERVTASGRACPRRPPSAAVPS